VKSKVKAGGPAGSKKPGGPAPKPNRLRIVGGLWRGRTFEAPIDDTIRPTSDRVRESLFNRLMHGAGGSGVRVQDARVVDVFSGTGAMGLEALSRGAAHATFIERDPTALALIRRNIAILGAEDRASVVSADATALPLAATVHNLAFLDPPYGQGLSGPAMLCLRRQGWLAAGALVCLETDAGEPPPGVDGYRILDRRAYGRVAVTLFVRD